MKEDNSMQQLGAIKPLKKLAGPDGQPVDASLAENSGLPEPGPDGRKGLAGRLRNIWEHAGKDGKKLSVKDLMFKDDISPLDLEYMTEADAAIYRYGKPRAYVISLGILVFFLVVFLWAATTNLDEITRAFGQVVPAQSIQDIQNLEGGVLQEVAVRQGDVVETGQIVARISNTVAASTLQERRGHQALLEATVLRLMAERDRTPLEFPTSLVENYPEVVRGQRDLYNTHREQFEGEMRSLEGELEQRRREVEESQARQRSLRSNLALSRERVEMALPLYRKGSISKMDFSKLEQEVNTLEGELEATTQAISRSRSAVGVAEEKINTRRLEWQMSVQEELSRKRAEYNSVSALLEASKDAAARTDLRSPVRGKVKRIHINTVGGSVAPGATIMEILPVDDKLLIEARVSPSDRAFLRVSDNPAEKQKAVVKFTSYDFAVFGGLSATLESISDDTFEDNRGELYYEIKLLTESNAIFHNGKAHEILPGMTAQVDIITGKKTVLSYLLKPIIRAKQNAMREP